MKLLERATTFTLYNLGVQNMLITIFKCLHLQIYLKYHFFFKVIYSYLLCRDQN